MNDDHQPAELNLAEPTFDSFTLELDAAAQVAAAVELAAAVLGPGWTAEAIHPQYHPGGFDLLPDEGTPPPDPATAWERAYELAARDGVRFAEPVFDVSMVGDDPGADPGDVEAVAELQDFGAAADPDEFDWSLKLIDVYGAWELDPPAGGRRFGAGSRVGHPDSGFIRHGELGSNLLAHLGVDFVDRDATTENPDGHHGLGTASVIMSQDNRAELPRSVTGVAPAAELVPFRVAKKRPFIPVPVLFRSGMRRLRQAIYAALDRDCHVLSISLGWLKNKGVKKALQVAVGPPHHCIVIAAAGNYTSGMVIWPGHYPETIALAACDARRRPWRGSARGRAVDFTGPGHLIWRADVEDYIAQSSGSSHATATTAGLAALWLAFRGRDALLERYRGTGITLKDVFYEVLRRSADPPPVADGRWGHGIVNAKACLAEDLPLAAELGPVAGLQDFGAGEEAPDSLPAVFDTVAVPEARRRLAGLLGVPPERLDDAVRGRRDEVLFSVLTEPSARAWMQRPPSSPAELQDFGAAPTLRPLSASLENQLAAAR